MGEMGEIKKNLIIKGINWRSGKFVEDEIVDTNNKNDCENAEMVETFGKSDEDKMENNSVGEDRLQTAYFVNKLPRIRLQRQTI